MTPMSELICYFELINSSVYLICLICHAVILGIKKGLTVAARD